MQKITAGNLYPIRIMQQASLLHIPLIPDTRTGLYRTLFSKKIAV
jgi:hypothetical protein